MKHIFLDMDGTLAEYYTDDSNINIDKFPEGFFLHKRPLKMIRNYLKKQDTCKLYILSASPSGYFDIEKRHWLKKHYPFLPKENIYLVRWKEEDKVDVLEDICKDKKLKKKDVYLIDDDIKVLYKAEDHKFNPIHVSRFIGMIERGEEI